MRLLLVLTLWLLAACAPGQAQTTGHSEPSGPGQELREVLATVRFVSLEGGFFGLVATDGTQYDPTNLPKEFQQDGLEVKAILRPRRGMVSYRMWGTIVDIVAIEKR